MRERWIRSIALVIGLLGIASVALQFVQAWPAGGLQLKFLVLQAIVVCVFVIYGLGLAYGSPNNKSPEPPLKSDGKSSEEDNLGLPRRG